MPKIKKMPKEVVKLCYDDFINVENRELDEEGIELIYKLVEEARTIDSELTRINEEKKQKEDRKKWIEETKLPEIFLEYNLEEIKTKDGLYIPMKEGLKGSITEATREKAHQWLRDNGFEDLIKNIITVWFEKGEDNKKQPLIEVLEELDLIYEEKESVHYQTLNSFIKECKEKAINLPQDLFNIFTYRVCKIKGESKNAKNKKK